MESTSANPCADLGLVSLNAGSASFSIFTYGENMNIDGLTLERTCYACPEQYDVRNAEGYLVGYMRLRHGFFTVECPDIMGTKVYKALPEGDGVFQEHEQLYFLTLGVRAINKWLEENKDYEFTKERNW